MYSGYVIPDGTVSESGTQEPTMNSGMKGSILQKRCCSLMKIIFVYRYRKSRSRFERKTSENS